jgi:hypothetical protein
MHAALKASKKTIPQDPGTTRYSTHMPGAKIDAHGLKGEVCERGWVQCMVGFKATRPKKD